MRGNVVACQNVRLTRRRAWRVDVLLRLRIDDAAQHGRGGLGGTGRRAAVAGRLRILLRRLLRGRRLQLSNLCLQGLNLLRQLLLQLLRRIRLLALLRLRQLFLRRRDLLLQRRDLRIAARTVTAGRADCTDRAAGTDCRHHIASLIIQYLIIDVQGIEYRAASVKAGKAM